MTKKVAFSWFTAFALAAGGMTQGACAAPEAPDVPDASPAAAAPEEPSQPAPTFGIRNAVFAEPDVLAAGQPSESELDELANAGYRTVIDLRQAQEDRGFDEGEHVAAAGMTYRGLPVGSEPLTVELFESFGQELAQAERPLLVHCASSNRVGALWAGWLAVQGGDPEEAITRGRELGLTSQALEERVRAVIDRLDPPREN